MISFVIPAYNEENGIEETVAKCQQVLDSLKLNGAEIVVVDDCSSDGTLEKLRHLDVTVVHHPVNCGYGRSLKDGIAAAKNDTIVITDADGTYPIERTPDLLSIYQKGVDMAVGARENINKHDTLFKYAFRRMLRYLVEFTAGRKIPDINSGFRVFSKKTIMPYFGTLSESFSFTTSSTLAYMMTGKMVTYMPIAYHVRKGNSKVRLFRDSIRTLQYVLEAIMFYNPIKLFIVFSLFLLAAASVCFGLHIAFTDTRLFWLGLVFFALCMFSLILGFISIQLKQVLFRSFKSNNS